MEDSSGGVEPWELKSGARTNPIANRSLEMWKTFGNWVRAVRTGQLKVEDTIFHLRVWRERSGAICEEFARASTLQEATIAVEKAKGLFFTSRGRLRRDIPEDLRREVEEVFAPDGRDKLHEIVRRFQLSFGTKSSYEELLDRLKTKFIDEDICEDVLLHALGWVKKEIDGAIERNEPPNIAFDVFRTEINSFRDRLKSRAFLPSFAGVPTREMIESLRLRGFVRQMQFIEFAEDRILHGITDFLAAKTNRVHYAQHGLVHSESFSEFQRALESAWRNHRDEIELNQEEDEVSRGKLLAFRCFREKVRLQGMDVPWDFVPGCFHALADVPTIGWHPRYAILLDGTGIEDV